MVYSYTINMPYLDDYTFIVDCINLKIAHLTPGQLLTTVFYPHGEHIIVFARLVAMLDYLLEGELNFRTLFFIGNATLLGTIWVLYRLARQGGLSVLQTLPIFWLLLQPQFYENTLTWAICALQHVPALFFAFSAFYLLSQSSSRSFWGSLPLAFLATFSNGNGLAVLGVGLMVVTVCRSRQYTLIWLLFAAVSGGIFYYFSQFSAAAPVSGNLSHPFRVLGGFFLMSGSMGLLFTRSLTALSLIGIGLTMVFVLVSGTALIRRIAPAYWLRYAPDWLRNRIGSWSVPTGQPVSISLIAGYLYLVITLAGISFARGQGWHYGLILPRFIWFATVSLVVGYLMVMLWVKPDYRKTIGWSVVCFSIAFNTFAYWSSFAEVKTINQSLLSDFHNWRENRLLITMPANKRGNDSFYATLMEAAIREGVYKMPPAPLDLTNRRQTSQAALKALVTKDSSFSLDERRYRYLTIDPTALAPLSQQPFNQTAAYLLLRSARHTFLWPINQSRTKLSLFLVTGHPLQAGPLATIMTDMLPAASYQLGVCYAQKGQWITKYSAETMQVSASN
ncbi:hypothetical protein [Spirosoma utsteinense]|uniref:Uncharacterized protein n=1 Tax=Spirosoma utsteinense TaxID=2585773 RepID=A0ABR6W524_9BACT|nr:hypothetical protein [Spirosoma utsteinense]MBC3785553.1 hypothetical protein [Spirosoma utsteinense]MBC3791701.1 hypothetical protein [Spirosoma utsteinense]